ncbi:MAG TPA: hypothetical protein ENK05_09585 [Gammaproteobacteria bacterium]|nr:hypothetical protein [Gammaproteobacteria bacterium]
MTPRRRIHRFLGAILALGGLGLLGGCATVSPLHTAGPDTAPAPERPAGATTPAGQAATLLERDLTVRWANRHYWPTTDNQPDAPPVSDRPFTNQGGASALQVRRLSVMSSAPDRQPAPRNGGVQRPAPTQARNAPVRHRAPPPLPPGLSYRIWFAPETEVLGPEGRARIRRISDTLKRSGHGGRTVWLRGYVLQDETPPSRERFAVGRALSVRKAMRANGVPLTTPVRIYHPKLDVSARFVEVSIR